jgi:hypothetical protein
MHSANWDESVDFKDKVVGGILSTHQILIRLAHHYSDWNWLNSNSDSPPNPEKSVWPISNLLTNDSNT